MAELTDAAVRALENVARDSTLKGLNLDIKGFQSGVDSAGAKAKDAGGAFGSLGGAVIDSTSALFKFGGTVFSSGAKVSDVFGTTTGIIGKFGGALGLANSNFAKITSSMGDGALAVIKAAENGVDTYRTLSSSGASFNNDILLMKNSAAQSRLTLDEFAGVVSNNTAGLAAFGGTVTKGATLFADTSRKMFDDGIATPLLNMGMTFEEVNEDLAEYMIRNRRRFTEEEIRNGDAGKAMAAMSTEMDKIAKLTGQNRKELEKETNDRMRKGQVDAKIRLLEAQGNKAAADKMKLALAEAAKAGPGALAAVEDLFTKGAVVSEEGRQAAVALGPAFNDLTAMVNYAKGKGGIDGMRASINNFNDEIAARIQDPNFLQIATLGGMGNATADASATMLQSAGTYSDNIQKLIDNDKNNINTREQAIKELDRLAKEDQKNREGVTSTVINGEKALRDMGAVINENLIGENGALRSFEKDLLEVGESLEGLKRADMDAKIKEMSDSLTRAASVVTGKDVPESKINAEDIEITEQQQKTMKELLKSMSNMENMQTKEASALAAVLGTEIGPMVSGIIKQEAERAGVSTEEQLKKILTTGSDSQIIKAAEDMFRQKNPDASDNEIKAFTRSLEAAQNAPLDQLLKDVDMTVTNMTVLNASGFSSGTVGETGSLFGEFGSGTLSVLHGKEAVLTEKQLTNLVQGVQSAGSKIKAANTPQQMGQIMAGLSASLEKLGNDLSANMKGSSQEGIKDIAEAINTNMGSMASELMKGNKVASKQLKSLGGLSGNLFKGLG